MSITSVGFILFLFFITLIFYLVPQKMQWYILLFASIVFYASCSIKGLFYVFFTSLSSYCAGRYMSHIDAMTSSEIKGEWTREVSKKEYKKDQKKRKKRVLIITLLSNVGILIYFKYFSFIIEQVELLFHYSYKEPIMINWMPLGLSFYTFQLIGYLLDVYWEYYAAESNWLKLLLFTSFFPQITQGPISSFEQLSAELFKDHYLTYSRFQSGVWRLFWGLSKKMIIADNLSPIVSEIFGGYSKYSGLTALLGAFLYAIQIYMDFSGYMDIMCGYCLILDIRLTENFDTPYFSKSVAEYWRRWHISLGEWFKKYIYYPIAMSSWSRRIGKMLSKKTNSHIGKSVPATLALIVTWLATGLWHGASWAYIIWGLLNGLFIILTLWLEPLYDIIRRRLYIDEGNLLWSSFQIVRTFILVMFIKVFPEIGDMSDGIRYWQKILFGQYSLNGVSEIASILVPSDPMLAQYKIITYATTIVLLTIVLILSIIKYRRPMSDTVINAFGIPVFFRILLLVIISLGIIIFGIPASSESVFMYAGF